MVDIALDTFPYNGTTTTCEALWMSVPVISLSGDRHAARVSASILKTIRHEELLTGSENDYVDLAVALAGDSKRLNEYRSTLRQQFIESSLCDPLKLTREIEAEYKKMSTKWRNSQS